jgi:ATP adenylyltransferase
VTSAARSSSQRLEPGSLWGKVKRTTRDALEAGTLAPLPVSLETAHDAGIRFAVRVLTPSDRKRHHTDQQKEKGENPFLPYETTMFVSDVSPTHLCLLNKFPAVPGHTLIVTRAFEEQTALLTRQDFEASWLCLQEGEALVFYNAGGPAGASQPHRHLQIVPAPLAPGFLRSPIDAVVADARFHDGMGRVEAFDFHHALARLRIAGAASHKRAAEVIHGLYLAMARAFGCDKPDRPYNLLLTRDWMLFVPRVRAHWERIGVNGLGFAGCLLVRGSEQLDELRAHGPLKVLREVSVSLA